MSASEKKNILCPPLSKWECETFTFYTFFHHSLANHRRPTGLFFNMTQLKEKFWMARANP